MDSARPRPAPPLIQGSRHLVRSQLENHSQFFFQPISGRQTSVTQEQLFELSLMLVYKIYGLLHEKGLTKKYSVSDFLNYLKYIRKAKINNVWLTGEITKATQTLLDKLEIHIT